VGADAGQRARHLGGRTPRHTQTPSLSIVVVVVGGTGTTSGTVQHQVHEVALGATTLSGSDSGGVEDALVEVEFDVGRETATETRDTSGEAIWGGVDASQVDEGEGRGGVDVEQADESSASHNRSPWQRCDEREESDVLVAEGSEGCVWLGVVPAT